MLWDSEIMTKKINFVYLGSGINFLKSQSFEVLEYAKPQKQEKF
tara:strand:- start:497 stop:628 length:132 start_codon:yes stop_codon:yes gene_type:complete